jgi:rubrerythrin
MTLIELLEQVEIETGVDVADMMVVANAGARRILKNITDGKRPLYIVSDVLTCGRCGHNWRPEGDSPPRVCPSCKSPYWNKPRKRIRPEK